MSRIEINKIKKEAKKVGRSKNLNYQKALDEVAQQHGYIDWFDIRDAHRRQVADDLEHAPPSRANAHESPPPVVIYKKSRKLP